MSMPITLPDFETLFADKNTSIPAPEPRSRTVSPSFRSANFIGAPQPTPKIDSCGIDCNSFRSYPIIFTASIGESFVLHSPGMQQQSELPVNAILPYLSFTLSFISSFMLTHLQVL